MGDQQDITVANNSLDIVTYYRDSVHKAQILLEGAVAAADGDYLMLNANLKGVNAYIKARTSLGDLIEKTVSADDASTLWDPFGGDSKLDTKLQVVQAKAEFTAVTTSESAAVALYQSGMTYRDIEHHTGLPQKEIKKVVQKQGVQRTNKKSVPVVK